MIFEWDPRKSATNFRKHGVSFAEAGTVFGDELSITVPDPNHSDQEERFLTIGWSNLHRLLMVAHADRGENLRIISARELTKTERKAYEEAN
jgi:uncharacterized DUF497 family protein